MTERVEISKAQTMIMRALLANSVSKTNASSVAKALIAAEIDGQSGHGFARVAAYCAQAKSGKVNGLALPKVERKASALLTVDACNGFSFPAIDAAIEHLVPLTKEMGIAAASLYNSHHAGQLGAHVERLADQGLVALMVANAPQAMAPWGGNRPLFGTNPIAFAAPREGQPPLVIDLSLSKVARGKVMAASKRGEPIPEGWALDSDGNPTTDAQAALDGMMIPMGDAKGAALALIVEILAATLTGANHSSEATSFFEADGSPPGVGQLIIAINPTQILGNLFAQRLETLLTSIEEQPSARLPGTGRLKSRNVHSDAMISIPSHLLSEIKAAANS